jgi:hypothetical protein
MVPIASIMPELPYVKIVDVGAMGLGEGGDPYTSALGGGLFKPMQFVDIDTDRVKHLLWCDAVYVRDFLEFDQLSAEQLLKLAAIPHENYGSYDLAAGSLEAYDRKTGLTLQSRYLEELAAAA